MARSEINLLPSAQWQHSWLVFLLKWTISYGRYIIIFTELIVILAFLSRFKFDQDLADLTDKIKTDKIILQSSRKFENEVSQTTKIQDLVIRKWQSQYIWSAYLNSLVQALPKDIVIKKINLSPNQINLIGSTNNVTALTVFLNNLKADPSFKRVNLSRISSSLSPKNSGVTTFSVLLVPTPIHVKYKS